MILREFSLILFYQMLNKCFEYEKDEGVSQTSKRFEMVGGTWQFILIYRFSSRHSRVGPLKELLRSNLLAVAF